MAQPYIGEIRMFAGNFAPLGWEFCHGQLLPVAENETLFQLIGTTYGGDGESTFALPDIRGRFPIHQGSGFILAETGGAEAVTLTVSQIPVHSHHIGLEVGARRGSGDRVSPAGAYFAASGREEMYAAGAGAAMGASALPTPAPEPSTATGGSQPHDNMPPYLAMNYIISLFGLFPFPT